MERDNADTRKEKIIHPFEIDKSNYKNMDDWFLVEIIELIQKY